MSGFDFGFKIPNGSLFVHGEGVNVKSAFTHDLDIPGEMHVFNPGNACDATTPTFKGSFGVLPFDTTTRMPRHIHLSQPGSSLRFLAEKVLALNGVGLLELAGEFYVISPMTMVIIAPGVPHAWTACPAGLHVQGALGIADDKEQIVSSGSFIAVYEHEDATAFFPTAQFGPLNDANDYIRCDDLQSIRIPKMDIETVIEKAWRGTYDRHRGRLQHSDLNSPMGLRQPVPTTQASHTPGQQNTSLVGLQNSIPSTTQPAISHRGNSEAPLSLEGNLGFSLVRGNAQAPTSPSSTDSAHSLASMFEAYLDTRHQTNIGQCGLFLLGEPSPLTFALAEFSQQVTSQLHNPGHHIRDSETLQVIQRDVHPSHVSAVDVAYLRAKGAFEMASERTLDDLMVVFLTRFYPLYSIVNKVEMEKVYKERKMPWILLHATCFVGATFCDVSVIHRSGFASRLQARRHFYDRAKVLFDLGYESNKIILLQSAIMLSFWGPQMGNHWNPCSWISFGVTAAVSLGLHRSVASSNAPRGDKGLLRRLWWTLAGRDAHCSALLGRPFRINLAQCDTGMLALDDFDSESQVDGFYQVEVAKLSLILREIVHRRFGPGEYHTSPENVHTMLESWYAELQESLDKWRPAPPPFLCSSALDLFYNYYRILLYIPTPPSVRRGTVSELPTYECEPKAITESAAREVASTAVTIMTETLVCSLPHELFPSFFLAGIVLYRQKQESDTTVAQLAKANLDNCRIVLNEARELWDLADWAMRIFEFLCSSCKRRGNQCSNKTPENASMSESDTVQTAIAHEWSQDMQPGDGAVDLGLDGLVGGGSTGRMEDFLYMLDIFPSYSDQ
ncbi:hypothetical protein G7Z17_g5507 [Cylindrodendrum hubeiense]|uniref:Xylanolytic transcriptional activator regulatory domain-containing protein n=1 Tax=Cylindrodendrum hubeiense TaxID=595255 RepID=A0A9P5H700_9HYPO|nr:hypothetical protein G7Z17_g5507 [Cylindrodendrum hubeiense]